MQQLFQTVALFMQMENNVLGVWQPLSVTEGHMISTCHFFFFFGHKLSRCSLLHTDWTFYSGELYIKQYCPFLKGRDILNLL